MGNAIGQTLSLAVGVAGQSPQTLRPILLDARQILFNEVETAGRDAALQCAQDVHQTPQPRQIGIFGTDGHPVRQLQEVI